MRVVLDTNVLISAAISTGTTHDLLVRGFEGEYDILVSTETMDEFEDTLLKYPDRFGMNPDEISRERETIEFFAEFVVPDIDLQVVERDPDDDVFLEVAVSGDADYLVSGDKHLTDLESFREIPILTPREFLDSL